jgi:hypothetical protein
MEDLISFIKVKKKKAKKLRGKHSPLSELVDGASKILKIEKIYILPESNHHLLFIIKNHLKTPKKRIFLAISIASQSSDLLVNIARNMSKNKGDIRFVQYSLYPDTSRVNLIAMLEVYSLEEYERSIDFLTKLRTKYRKELISIVDNLKS